MAKGRNKYSVAEKEDRTVDGILFDSKKEARRYGDLKLMRKAGVVSFFLRQVPFHLPGKTTYRCDFVVFYADGTVAFEDVKGMRTQAYKLKKRQVEELYKPVVILEI